MMSTDCTLLPLVSVVIPCYRQAHFLGQAIESVLQQSYPQTEIIVIDDGSPDETSAVAARYPGVRCIRQTNQGLSAARNAGLRAAQGEFVAFLDADDVLLPDWLAAAVRTLLAQPAAGLVFGRYQTMDDDGSRHDFVNQLNCGVDMYAELLKVNFIAFVGAVVYRRACFAVVGEFDASVNPAADYDMYLRFARHFPFARYDAIAGLYRVYGSSMSANHKVMLKTTLIVLRRQWPYVEGQPHYEQAFRAGEQTWWGYYGELLYWQIRLSQFDLRQLPANVGRLRYLLRWYPQAIPLHLWQRLFKRGGFEG